MAKKPPSRARTAAFIEAMESKDAVTELEEIDGVGGVLAEVSRSDPPRPGTQDSQDRNGKTFTPPANTQTNTGKTGGKDGTDNSDRAKGDDHQSDTGGGSSPANTGSSK